MSSLRILLAEDHRMVREGLRTLLNQEPNMSVIGETGSGLEVAKLIEKCKPQVLVMDVMMPGLNGLEVTRQVCRKSPHPHVIILSMHANEAYVVEALRNGASAYVLKDASSTELVRAIHEVLAGRRYLSPPLSESSVQEYMRRASQSGALDTYETLTNREREVFQLCAEGHTNPAIARKLFISPRTVETHRANLMHKLRLRSQSELIRFAIQKGILPIEEHR